MAIQRPSTKDLLSAILEYGPMVGEFTAREINTHRSNTLQWMVDCGYLTRRRLTMDEAAAIQAKSPDYTQIIPMGRYQTTHTLRKIYPPIKAMQDAVNETVENLTRQ